MSLAYYFARSNAWSSSIKEFTVYVNNHYDLSKFVSISATHGHNNSESLFIYNYSNKPVTPELSNFRLYGDYALSKSNATWEDFLATDYKNLINKYADKKIVGSTIT